MRPSRLILTFVLTVGLLAAWPGAHAQEPTKVARVGVLSLSSAADVASWHRAFRQGLADLGWVEGNTVGIEYRYADGRLERLPELAADLVRLKVDVIVTGLNTDTQAAQKATKTIPIVMASPGDPIGTGLIASLARPGGNITGLTTIIPKLAGKRLELLKEMVPKLSHVAVL